MELDRSTRYSPSWPINGIRHWFALNMPTMSSLRLPLKAVLSDWLSIVRYSQPPIEWRIAFGVASWLHSLRLEFSASLGAFRSQRLLALLSLVTLQAMGLAYASGLIYAENAYALSTSLSPQDSIQQLRNAARFDPFDWQMRSASARAIFDYAMQSNDRSWQQAALNEINVALLTDYTDGDLLKRAMILNWTLGNNQEAAIDFAQFKRVSKASPLIELVEKTHHEGQ